jgi:hypothetical protein
MIPIFGESIKEGVSLMIDDQYKGETDIFHNIAVQVTSQSNIEIPDMPFILQLLSTLDNAPIRFIGSFALKYIFRYKIKSDESFKKWLIS